MSGLQVWRNRLPPRRVWLVVVILGSVVAVVAALFLAPRSGTSPGSAGGPAAQPAAHATATGAAPGIVSEAAPRRAAADPTGPPARIIVAPGEPRTLDFAAYAEATARALYTWDSRASTYTQVYEHVRSWWVVLADGSNPLTVYTQEFEGTGINAASFAQLSTYRAYRTSKVVQTSCDASLAQVRDHPAPWPGLHVCTVVLDVTDRSTTDPHAVPYRVPVSVMVNCPPARTAPADRCVLAGFETAAARIVY